MKFQLEDQEVDFGDSVSEEDQKAIFDTVSSTFDLVLGGIKTKRDQLITQNRTLKDQANKPDESVVQLNDRINDLQDENISLTNKATVAENTNKRLETKLAEQQGETDNWQNQHNTLVKKTALSKQLMETGVSNPALLEGAEALLLGQTSLGEENQVLMGDKTLSEALKEWADTDAGKAFVGAGGNAGGDGSGGKSEGATGDNPWKTGNSTQQQELMHSNPELAKTMMAEAGPTSYPTPAVQMPQQQAQG